MGPNLPAIPDTQRHSQPHRSDTRTSPSVLSRIGLGLPARLAQPEVFIHFKEDLIADDGSIANDSTRKFLQGFVDDYVAWIRRFAR